MKKFLRFSVLCLISIFMLLIVLNPEPCKKGVINGLLLCGRVIIPSLFPFTVCVLFLVKTDFLSFLKPISKITAYLFNLDSEQFSIALLSFIGGYPIGAKLLNEAVTFKKISPEKAGVMLNFCINAGPAFIISAVGSSVFNMRKIGILLYISHLSASVIICLLSRKKLKDKPKIKIARKPNSNIADNFVISVSGASSAMMNICGFVILFSCINASVLPLCKGSETLTFLCGMLETTNALALTKNIYLISFFLGFSGICVWFQVLSICKNIKIKIIPFILCRLSHGALSSLFTYVLLKIFKITLPTLSNNRIFSTQILYGTPALAVSMAVTGIVFVAALTTRKYNCKILEDIV